MASLIAFGFVPEQLHQLSLGRKCCRPFPVSRFPLPAKAQAVSAFREAGGGQREAGSVGRDVEVIQDNSFVCREYSGDASCREKRLWLIK